MSQDRSCSKWPANHTWDSYEQRRLIRIRLAKEKIMKQPFYKGVKYEQVEKQTTSN